MYMFSTYLAELRAIFQKKDKKEQKMLKRTKKGKIFENLGKIAQNLKIF